MNNFMRRVQKVLIFYTMIFMLLTNILHTWRLCKTAITWLLSLSAILPLFWRHDIAELHRLCREDLRNVLWRHKICDVFREIWLALYKTCIFHSILQRHITFSLLIWLGSPNFFLLVRTTIFPWEVFNKIWMIRLFTVVNYMVRKFSFCSYLCEDVIANIILLHIYINLKKGFISWNMILKLNYSI